MDLFHYLKINRREFPRRLVGSCSGELIIIGTARCVWEDIRGLCQTKNVMCVNDIGMHYPGPFIWWYSNEIEQLIHWNEGRHKPFKKRYSDGHQLISACKRDGEDYRDVHHFPVPCQGGSGVAAVLVALILGYDDITCAGMPFDNSGHYYNPPTFSDRGHFWSDFVSETPDSLLENLKPLWKGKVKFLSGRMMDE